MRPFFRDALDEGCLSALFAGTSPRIVVENIRGEYICPPDSIEDSSNQAKDEKLGEQFCTLSDSLVRDIMLEGVMYVLLSFVK
jgi:WW domain-containing oxidoreductase